MCFDNVHVGNQQVSSGKQIWLEGVVTANEINSFHYGTLCN